LGSSFAGDVTFDWGALKTKRDAYITRLNGIYSRNLGSSGVTMINGDAKFIAPKTVAVGEDTYTVR
jgi:glutathione reductase (NADPH)